MKKIISLAVAIVFPLLAIAQNEDVVGNNTISTFNQEANFKANFSSGIKCTLTNEGLLTSLGMIGKGTGTEAQLALYSDENGAPGHLISVSEIALVTQGAMKLKIKPTKLVAGDYWIMGVYNQEGAHVFASDTNESNEVYYNELEFGSQFPTSASAFQTYKGHNFAYFLNLKAGAKGSNSAISVYPNPVVNVANVHNSTGKEMTVELFDFLGNRKTVVTSEATVIEIDMTQMNNGNYILLINHSISKQIVKK